jgi:hypothetical protein
MSSNNSFDASLNMEDAWTSFTEFTGAMLMKYPTLVTRISAEEDPHLGGVLRLADIALRKEEITHMKRALDAKKEELKEMENPSKKPKLDDAEKEARLNDFETWVKSKNYTSKPTKDTVKADYEKDHGKANPPRGYIGRVNSMFKTIKT